MFYLGVIIVVLTFVAIIKQYETRMVLFLSGLLMALLAGEFTSVFTSFSKAMVNEGLVVAICTVMGFAYVMKLTECDKHLVLLLSRFLIKVRFILIPGTVFVTFIINTALVSAAGCAAAVGAILIPVLKSVGVHPAIAAAAVLAGTWGSVFSPGSVQNPFIAKIANVDVMTVVAGHSVAAITAMLIVAVMLNVVAIIRKENKGYVSDEKNEEHTGKANLLKALVPIVPLLLLILSSKQIHLIPPVSVTEAMLTGIILSCLIARINPKKISETFFSGMGNAYGNIIGIIIGAMVFINGMEQIGIIQVLTDVMKNSVSAAKFAATFGPMVIAVLSGSGEAATLAFNGAVTVHAADFGMSITHMGSQAYLSGALGRILSPVAGATIVCAQIAGVTPIEVVKRNVAGTLLAIIVTLFILL
ncbi:C4-dicarboxylate transporter DcuC [Pectobacterium sp. HCp5_1]|uniref:C4-dicarboxylate transporter DcuC n=1 Tax=Pectobacterium sp. HCp5_1 TaxID=3062446 RepID=UPI00293BF349|nr:C4-dicarboxylate transporter DcuC [Pectobacterium sp. HCp5_1]